MILSEIIFVLILLIVQYMAYLAEIKNNKKYVVLCIITLTLLAGLRGENVGIDTKSYYYNISNGFPYSWMFDELGFRAISTFLYNIFHNVSPLIIIYAALTNGLILVRLWDFKDKSSFSFMCLIYIGTFFLGTMNIMRQFIAIAITFYATRFLDKSKYAVYFILIAFATTIHQSALLALLYFVIYFWQFTSSTRKHFIFVLPFTIIVVVGIVFIYRYERSQINHYLANVVYQPNYIRIFELFFVLLTVYLETTHKKIIVVKTNVSSKYILGLVTLQNKETIFYILGILVAGLGMFFIYMGRLGTYYLMFEMVFWGRLVKNSKNKAFYKSVMVIIALYPLVIEMAKNGSQIFPYYTIFNS